MGNEFQAWIYENGTHRSVNLPWPDGQAYVDFLKANGYNSLPGLRLGDELEILIEVHAGDNKDYAYLVSIEVCGKSEMVLVKFPDLMQLLNQYAPILDYNRLDGMPTT